MGVADTVRAEVRCPECGAVEEREVQFKHPLAWQDVYEIGEQVPSAPAGLAAVEGRFGHTPEPGADRHSSRCWIHLHDGFVTDVTLERPETPTERDPAMVDRLGRAVLARKRGLRRVGSLVRRRRRSIEASNEDRAEDEDRDESLDFLRGPGSEEELLDRLEGAVEEALDDLAEPGPYVLW